MEQTSLSRVTFREMYTVPRWRIIVFVCLFSMLNQWIRWLPVYLSSVTFSECNDVCNAVGFTPLCISCDENDLACSECHTCRLGYDSEKYSLQDGVCMTTIEYGIITGIGFSLTFSTFGLIAGFFVDLTSDRGSTILGLSSIITGIVTLLSSLSSHFYQILILRAILGAMQAFGAPASVHLITTYFKRPSERPFANASYTTGLYLGAGLSSLSTLASEKFGWRVVYVFVGCFTILVALLFEAAVDLTAACGKGGWIYDWRGEKDHLYTSGGYHVDEKKPLLTENKSNVPMSIGGLANEDPEGMNEVYHKSITVTMEGGEADEEGIENSNSQSTLSRTDVVVVVSKDQTSNSHTGNTDEATPIKNPITTNTGLEAAGMMGTRSFKEKESGKDPKLPTTSPVNTRRRHSADENTLTYTTLEDIVHRSMDSPLRPTLFSKAGMGGGYDSGLGAMSDSESSVTLSEASFGSNYARGNRSKRGNDGKGRMNKSGSGGLEGDSLAHATDSSTSPLRAIFHLTSSLFLNNNNSKYALPVLFLGSCMRFVASITTFVYIPVLVTRRFPDNDRAFSWFNAVVVLSCGSLSSFLGGRLGQLSVKKAGISSLSRLVATSCLFSIPPFLLSFVLQDFWLSMSCLAMGYLVGEAWMGAAMALLQSLAPRSSQGLAMSIFLFLNWNFAAFATDLVGYFDPGTEDLANLLVAVVVVALLISFMAFLILDRILGGP